MQWLNIVGWLVAIVFSLPLVILAVECLVALLPSVRSRSFSPGSSARPPCAILIPAHNEELILERTLASVAAQLQAGDRVIVVADNCTDATAEVARKFGVEAVERTDSERRGKGYALAFGRDVLTATPPEIVVVLDADCTLGPSALPQLVLEASTAGRPVQANYQMIAPAEAGPSRHVAAFAFLVKNFVRPLGLRRLQLPCLLTGTGMAFPWHVFRDAPLAHGHIVEDMGMAVDLALAGQPPLYLRNAEVFGEFPVDERAADSQRRRWEHGHLQVIVENIPRLLMASILRGRIDLLALALDISVPPLSALILATGLILAGLGVLAASGGSSGPVVLLGSALLLMATILFAVWWRYGRQILSAKSMAQIPLYAARKLPLYFAFLVKPQKEWVRTARDEIPNAQNKS